MSLIDKYKNNCRELTAIIYKQEKQIQFLETKALHLSMFYVAFQLLIFLSNSKPSPHQCRNWWRPFALSVCIAIVFIINFAVTISKYMRIKYAQERNYLDQNDNYHQMSYLERHGNNIVLSNNNDPPLSTVYAEAKRISIKKHSMEPDLFAVYQRYAHVAITISALLGYTVVILQSCRSSPCADIIV